MRPNVLLIAAVLAGAVLAIGVAAQQATTASEQPGYARQASRAAKSLLLHATRAGKRIVAVGEFGHVLLSDDEGKQWRQARSVPTTTTLTAVTFVDDKLGWTVGHGGLVLATRDGGETWTIQTGKLDAEDSLFSVWFRDANRGMAVGPYGYAIVTSDGGKSWDPVTLAEGEDGERHLNGIFAGPRGQIFVAAEGGRVFRSTDEGRNWQLIALPYKGSVWGGMTLKDGAIVVWAMRGHALLSRDGGETWTELQTGTDQSLTGGAELDDGRLVLVGAGGAMAFGTADQPFKSIVRDDRQVATAVLPAGGGVLFFSQAGAAEYALQK
jgi:photosystem II stability/assembly factor-like uncharacterized protein